RAYQNRLLMPSAINLLINFGLEAKKSLLIIYLVGIFLHNLILIYCLKKMYCDIVAWVSLLVWTLLFCFYQHYWFYPWDIFDISLFTITTYVLASGKHKNSLLILYPIALLNRESALFLPIAYWLVLNFP